MKIGILTYHRSHNYGALLQAYALKTYLTSLSHKVNIIDYWPDYHRKTYVQLPNFSSHSFFNKIKTLTLFIIGYTRIIRRKRFFEEFIEKQIHMPRKIMYNSIVSINGRDFDMIIYGSDQIWRKSAFKDFKGFNKAYWGFGLEECPRKVTYAASMGVISLLDEDKQYIRKMLRNFNRISVREKSLKDAIASFSDVKVETVLDPVFLLDSNYWLNLSNKVRHNEKSKYILFYNLTYSKEALKLVKELQSHKGYKVLEITGRVASLKFGGRYIQTASPFLFLSLIRNAEIVVSSSFHGVAFSLLFQKQFYGVGMGNNSERVTSLLDSLGIQNRYVCNDVVDFEQIIDYSIINPKLNRLIEESKRYLINSIE